MDRSRAACGTVGYIAKYYLENRKFRAKSTQYLHAHNVEDYLSPRWGDRIAIEIKPKEITRWLDSLSVEELGPEDGLENPTRYKLRTIMGKIYRFAQAEDQIPRREECNPIPWVECPTTYDYEPILVTPEQVFEILHELPQLERTLTLLIGVTGLRISEALGLQWQDIDHMSQQINIRRTWNTKHRICNTKTKGSRACVPCHPLLGEMLNEWHQETIYAGPNDWVFPSHKMKGRIPRTGNMLVEDYLRPAALRVGIKGVEDESRRFGFHNLRHALSSYLQIKAKVDPKVVQKILRHDDINTTMNIYTHAMDSDRIEAQGLMLEKLIQKPKSDSVQ